MIVADTQMKHVKNNNDYLGLVWTNHALKRLKQRRISRTQAWATWVNPDKKRFAATKQAYVYERRTGNKVIVVVAKKQQQKWLVLSAWEKTSQNKVRSSFLFKLWKGFKKLIRLFF